MSKKGYIGFDILGEEDRRTVAGIIADCGYEVLVTREGERFKKIPVLWIKVPEDK